jgi:hypothetical protein
MAAATPWAGTPSEVGKQVHIVFTMPVHPTAIQAAYLQPAIALR